MNRKEEQWRNEGAAYALRTAKAKGIDGLEADLRCRGICGISVVVPEEHLKRHVFGSTTQIIRYH